MISMKKRIALISVEVLIFAGCANTPVSSKNTKIIIEQSYSGSKPEWIAKDLISWSDDQLVYFKTSYTIRGDQRVNGCYELAKLLINETLVGEIKSEVKAESNLANEGISEGNDVLLTKSITHTSEGIVKGLRSIAQAYERSLTNEIERVECFVLTQIPKSEYAALKSQSINNLLSVKREVAEAVRKRQSEFFNNSQKDTSNKTEE